MQGMSIEEIASKFNIKYETVASYIYKVLIADPSAENHPIFQVLHIHFFNVFFAFKIFIKVYKELERNFF